MTGFPHARRTCLLAMAVVALATRARAQDEDIIIEEAPAVVENRVMWTDENFDQWVFGGRNIPSIRTRMDSLLAAKVADVDRVCSLSDAQKKKLQLAGKGDLKHFFDRVAEKKRKFQTLKNDQNKINEIFQEIQPLQLALNNGPYDDGSIFHKTIASTLDDAQMQRYRDVQRETARFRYKAKVELVVATLDQALGMKGDQRKKCVDLILAETEPPGKYGQYDYYYVMYQAAKLPQDRIKPIFDDAQWKVLQNQFTQAKGMEQFLKQNGFLTDEDIARPNADEFRKPADIFVNPAANRGREAQPQIFVIPQVQHVVF